MNTFSQGVLLIVMSVGIYVIAKTTSGCDTIFMSVVAGACFGAGVARVIRGDR